MKLSQYRESYYSLSGSASSVGRQAAFAGIALVWIFKTQDAGQSVPIVLPEALLLPTLAFIVSLASDLLQYISGAAIWGFYCRYKEKELGAGNDDEFSAPIWLNWPALVFFWVKHAAVITGYVFLFFYVMKAVGFVDA